MDNNNIPPVQSSNPIPSEKKMPKKFSFKLPGFNWRKFMIALFFITVILLGAWFAVQYYTYGVYRVLVSNVSSRSATISWVTADAEPGMVVYREGNSIFPFRLTILGASYSVDDRDYSTAELESAIETQENIAESESGGITSDEIVSSLTLSELGEYWTHHITVRNLEPETEYEFMVGNGNIFKKVSAISTEASTFTTRSELEEISTPDPAYGTVRYYDEEEEIYLRSNDAVVYAVLYENFSESESQPISSVTNVEGGWYLDVSNAYMESGEKFFDSISDFEAVDIVLKLTLENAWFGRWTKDVNYMDATPADTIDLREDEKDEDGLEFEGYSCEDLGEEQALVSSKVFAQGYIGDWQRQQLQKDRTNYAYAANMAARTANYYKNNPTAIASVGEERAAEIVSEMNRQMTVANKITKAAAEGDAMAVANLKKEVSKSSSDSSIASAIAENDEDDPKGQCGGDICEPDTLGADKLRCGRVNAALCRCVCPAGTVDIGPGQYCSCSANGTVNETSEALGLEVEPLSEQEGAKDRLVCSNNNGGGSKVCFSSTNNCWYGGGHSANNGLECFGTSSGNQRWIDPADRGYWEGKDAEEEPVPEEEEVDSGGGQCWNLNSTGQRIWSSLPYSSGLAYGWSIDPKIISSGQCEGYVTPEIDFDEGNCDDYWGLTSGNLIIPDGEKFWNCKRNNTWEETEYNCDYEIGLGNRCCFTSMTSIDNGERIDCNHVETVDINGDIDIVKKWVIDSNPSKEVSQNVDLIASTQECGAEFNYCIVKWGDEDKEVRILTPYTVEPGWTPSDTEDSLIINRVRADSTTSETFVIDTENGTVEGLNPGIYEYENEDGSHVFVIGQADYYDTEGIFSLYIDVNKNGDLDDEDVLITDNAETIKLTPLIEGFVYKFSSGFNFVSFPFVLDNTSINMASELLNYLNEIHGGSFYSIAMFDSGRWKVVGGNGGNFDQNDFQIIPGEGYLIKAKWDIDITLYGKEVNYESSSDSAPIRFIPGWNLVGLYGSGTKSYTAQSLLEDVTDYSEIDFTAVNVSRWLEERTLYEGLQRESGEVYGLDFPIEKQRGYFVKITKGKGNWEPGLR